MSLKALRPKVFSPRQNYPDPFNPVTTIQHTLPSRRFITLRIYDLPGRAVKTLVNEIQDEGYASVEFDAGDLASSIYQYELRACGFSVTRQMGVVKWPVPSLTIERQFFTFQDG